MQISIQSNFKANVSVNHGLCLPDPPSWGRWAARKLCPLSQEAPAETAACPCLCELRASQPTLCWGKKRTSLWKSWRTQFQSSSLLFPQDLLCNSLIHYLFSSSLYQFNVLISVVFSLAKPLLSNVTLYLKSERQLIGSLLEQTEKVLFILLQFVCIRSCLHCFKQLL